MTKKFIIVLFICIIISGIVSCILGPACDWDFLSYHYYNGYAVLHGRIGTDFMVSETQSYFNPILDIIDYIIINTFREHKYIELFIAGIPWGVLGFSLYLISNLLFSDYSENNIVNNILITLAVVIGETDCIIFSEIGQSFHDITIAFLIMFSLYFMLKYIKSDKYKHILYSGILAGIAFGLKLTAIPTALFITFFIVNLSKGFKQNITNCFIFITAVIISFLFIDGYWMYILYKNYHNPMFPLFNKFFKSELYTQVNYRDYRFLNTSVRRSLYYPLIWQVDKENRVSEINFFDLRHKFAYFACIFSLIIFSVKTFLKKPFSDTEKMELSVICFTIVSYFLWFFSFGIIRYLCPTLALSGILIVIFISKISKKHLSVIISIIITICTMYLYTSPNWGRMDSIIHVPLLDTIEENSIVLVNGKPLAYIAAANYKNVKFIGIENMKMVDGAPEDFHPTQKYYDLIDTKISNKKRYILTNLKYSSLNKYVREKVKFEKCTTLPDIIETKNSGLKSSNFSICQF